LREDEQKQYLGKVINILLITFIKIHIINVIKYSYNNRSRIATPGKFATPRARTSRTPRLKTPRHYGIWIYYFRLIVYKKRK